MSPTAGYSGTPLGRKLGLKPGQTVNLLGAPPGFVERLGEHGAGIRFRRRAGAQADGALLFVRSQAELERKLPAAIRDTAGGWIWIAWPKRASGVATDLSGGAVRAAGLAAGLVDSKVCAVDEVWSGHRFTPRRG